MIRKIIASDIDGTLIPFGQNGLDPKVFQLIEDLAKKDVLFVPASGRTIKNLHLTFEPVKNKLSFLSENGGAVWFYDKQVGEFPIPPEALSKIHQAILNNPDLKGYANSASNGYILEDTLSDNNKDCFALFMPPMINVSTLDDINDRIVKITALSNEHSADYHFPELNNRFHEMVDVAMAGPNVIDFCNTNKGVGLRRLTEYLNLTPADVFAFGDNYNDLAMLDYAGHSYMIETEDPVRRAAADHIIENAVDELEKLYMKL